MKKFLILLLVPFLLTVSLAQTQPNLPTGSKPFSSSIFISPNADLWTGKTGVYMNLAKKRYVDSLLLDVVSTKSLKINQDVSNPNWNRVPASSADGLSLVQGGLIASYDANINTTTALAKRRNGRIQVSNGSNQLDAVNKNQLDSLAARAIEKRSPGSSIVNSDNSAIFTSSNVGIIGGSGQFKFNNTIIGSNNSFIQGDTIYYNTIIGADNSRIGRKRQNSAIIASHSSEIKDGQIGDGFVKWNSAIIASYLCKVGASNSYTLVTGRGNETNGSAQFICGRYNLIDPLVGVNDPNKKTFVVGAGQGQDDQDIIRGNAFYVTHGGKAWVKNEMEVDAPGGGLVLKSPDGSRWKITVSNTGTLSTTKLP